MKLLKTIEKLIRESEDAYNKALESVVDEKELDRLEKNYKDFFNGRLLNVFYL